MKALLLSAGFGTRLAPLTELVPKCLVPINGVPLLAYWVDALLRRGVEELLVNLHHRDAFVRHFLENSPWRGRLQYVYEPTLLGTGGTLLANQDFFGETNPILLVHADNLSVFDVRRYLDCHAHRPPEARMTMMTFEADRPQTCGIVQTDSRGVIEGFFEKVPNPPGNAANGAVYLFEREIFERLKGKGKAAIDISTEILPGYVGQAQTFENRTYHRDIGSPQSYLLAHREFLYSPPSWPGLENWWEGAGLGKERFLQEFRERLEASAGQKIRPVPDAGALGQFSASADSPCLVWRVPKGFLASQIAGKGGPTVLAISAETR